MASRAAVALAIERDQALVQIGVLAERVGLSLRSVRYYEEVGLLAPATRSQGGFRLYGADQEQRLLLIKQMKPLGFSLEQMGELLKTLDAATSVTPESPSASVLVDELDREVDEIVLRRHELEKQLDAADRLARTLRGVARRLGGEGAR